LTSWLNSLFEPDLAIVSCGVFLLITLLVIALIHPFVRRWIQGGGQLNDVVILVGPSMSVVR